jgi:hypothetical protein
VPSLESELDEVAGTAAATGAAIFPIAAGVLSPWTRDFGATVAGLTGGRGNVGPADLRDVLARAGRGCACMYRIGLALADAPRSRVYQVRIGIGKEHRLPHAYRVQVLSDEKRWRRSATAVLLDPESARDIRSAAALLPVSARGGRWQVKAQVAVDTASIALLPSGADREARWEVGALLAREGGRRGEHHEMLGVSSVRCGGEGGCGVVVHERLIEGLRPGRWELRSFVRDRWTEVLGGARVAIELPAPGEGSVVGPLLATPGGSYLATALPLRTKRERSFRSQESRRSAGPRPLTDAVARPRAPLGLLSFVCDRRRGAGLPVTRRRLLPDEAPGVALTLAEPGLDGECWSIADVVSTSSAAAGSYGYELRWEAGGELDATTVGVSFEVTGGPAPAPGAPGEPDPAPLRTSDARLAEAAVRTGPPRPARAPEAAATGNHLLPELLDELGRLAARYRDGALRFTCDERIVERSGRKSRVLAFDYVYAYDEGGALRDHRMAVRQDRAGERAPSGPRIVDLERSGLPVYVLRAYSSIFIFEEGQRELYDFELVGEEEALGRPALKLSLAARPPYVEDVNDWIGAAWVDLETHALLRFRGMKIEDHEQRRLYEEGIEQSWVSPARRPHVFDAVEIEFGAEREGLRLPSRAVTRRTLFGTSLQGNYLRSPAHAVLEVEQSYENYRIYGVTATDAESGVRAPG